MHVAILIGRFPPHDVGGAERQADRLAAELAARGHRVTVLTRRWPGRAAREERDGFTIVRTPIGLAGPARSAFDTLATVATLSSLQPRPDVSLAFQTFASGWIAGLADAGFTIPSVVWVRGENEYRFDRHRPLYPIAKFAWKQARRVLVQSEAHRRALLHHLAALHPLRAERLAPRLEVLGNGVDVPGQVLPAGDDWLFVGRLIRHKGLPVLFDALAAARGTPAARPLWIVGDGPERAALEARARELDLDVRFEGMRPRDQLPGYYARARAIVLPSTEGEGLPNALLEAMAHGVPPVATALAGVEELVRGAGPVVDPGDAAGLAEALVAMSEPFERRRAAFVARQRAEGARFPVVAARLEGVLEAAARPAPRVWLVSPHPVSRGGVAAVARQMIVSPLSRRWRLSIWSTYRAGPALSRIWYGVTGIAAISAGLLFRKPAIVHIKLASGGSFARKFAVALLCRMRGVPLLVHVHGGGFDRFVSTAPPPVLAMARWMLEGAPQVLSLSDRWAEKLRALFPRARIEALPNPVDVERYSDLAGDRFAAWERGGEPAGPPTALFLGDLVERKGVFDLVATWSEVARAVPGARLVMAGRGEEERLRAAARDAGVAELVSFPGWVHLPDKRRLLREATLFVLPSYFEGVPISLLEAMAAGLPSVVTPVGGVLDAVTDGQEVLVVEPGDRAALARAIVQLLEAPGLARALAGSARLRVDAFDVGRFADRLDAVYRRILGTGGEAVAVAGRPAGTSAPSTVATVGGGAGARGKEAAR